MADDLPVHGLEGEDPAEAGDVPNRGEGFVGHGKDVGQDGGVIGEGEGSPAVAMRKNVSGLESVWGGSRS